VRFSYCGLASSGHGATNLALASFIRRKGDQRTMEEQRRQPPCSTAFGRTLKQYRERTADAEPRVGQCGCGLERRRARTIAEVVARMNALGCDLTEHDYAEIEERGYLPAELKRAFDTMVIALNLCEHEGVRLLRTLIYSLLEIELGQEIAASLIECERGRIGSAG
jgi:hypothetical protein